MKKMIPSAAIAVFAFVGTAAFGQIPDTFTWTGGTGTTTWDEPGVWTSATTARAAPGFAGDIIRTTAAADIFLSGDKTISGITDGGGRLVFRSATPSTITFDSGDPAVTNQLRISQEPFHASNVNASPDNDIVFNIVRAVRWNVGVWSHVNFRTYVGAKITGGNSPAAPVGFIVDSQNDPTHGKLYFILLNPGNDFRGDLHFGRDGGNNSLRVQLGHGAHAGYDSILGHPENRVYFHGGGVHLCVKAGDPGGFRRTLVGAGTLRGNEIDGGYNVWLCNNLILGDGCSLEPATLPSNPIGAISVTTRSDDRQDVRTITTHANAQAVITLGSGGACDKINFSSNGQVSYSGKVILEPQDDYPLGSQWTIMTVNNVPFSFSPSFVSPGFDLTVHGDSSSSWTVVATRVRDTSEAPDISTLPATLIGDTYATFNFNVLGTAESAVVRAYISEDGDLDDTFVGWNRIVEYPAACDSAGARSFKIEGLSAGVACHVRHSISNSAGEFMSLNSASFAPRPLDTPDVFKFYANSGVWHDESAWEHDSPYDRHIPGFVGDTAQIFMGAPPVSKHISLTNDATVSTMIFYQGNDSGEYATLMADNGPATLTFNTAAPGTPAQLTVNDWLQTMNFGASPTDANFTVNLARPLAIYSPRPYRHSFVFNAKVVGGTTGSPSDISMSGTGDRYNQMQLLLLNTNNTFRGDIFIGSATQADPASRLIVGNGGAAPFDDAMLGHPDNKIILRCNSEFRLTPASAGTAFMRRAVEGNGAVITALYDQYGALASYRALAFGAGAVLAPRGINGSGFGTITVSSSTFSDDPATKYKLDLDFDGAGNDKLVFNIQSAFALNGKLELTVNSTRPPVPGTSWEIIKINPHHALAQFDCNISKPAGYALATEGDAAAGWTVNATALPLSTLLILR